MGSGVVLNRQTVLCVVVYSGYINNESEVWVVFFFKQKTAYEV